MIKLKTTLVLGTVILVTVLSIVRLVLLPESWLSSLAALAFFPMAIGILMIRSGSVSEPQRARKVSRKLRAGLVGAGVLLATSLLLSIAEGIGLTERLSGGAFIAILSAIVAVAIDWFSGRLEKKAEEDPD